jgi:hypothetical protein
LKDRILLSFSLLLYLKKVLKQKRGNKSEREFGVVVIVFILACAALFCFNLFLVMCLTSLVFPFISLIYQM